jgi:hypothetical protein
MSMAIPLCTEVDESISKAKRVSRDFFPNGGNLLLVLRRAEDDAAGYGLSGVWGPQFLATTTTSFSRTNRCNHLDV